MTFEHGFLSLHIIESVGEADGEPGRKLKNRLSKKGHSFEAIPVIVHKVFGDQDLILALDEILENEAEKDRPPILHFEVHGNEYEICLRDDTRISWIKLGNELAKFNVATKFNLLAVFSCCNGFRQIDAINAFRICPITAMVGCIGTISTLELLNAFECFYNELSGEQGIEAAVKKMQATLKAGSNAEFGLETAARMFRSVIAAVYRDNRNSESFKKIKRENRRKAEVKNALMGNLEPISEADGERAFLQSLDRTLRRHYVIYFAIDEIPENVKVFPFDKMVNEVRQQILEGG